MTYAEQHGRKRADWLSFLRSKQTAKDTIGQAVRHCAYWKSDPLAHMENSHLIERDEKGKPKDERLCGLCATMYGHLDTWWKFYGHERGDMAQGTAVYLYHAIEQRLGLILQQNKSQTTLF